MSVQRSTPCVLVLLVVAVGCWSAAAICSPGTTSTDLIRERGYDLTGQTHVITGGDSGIGFGIALALAQANARVVFLGHDMNKTAAVMRDISTRTFNTKLSSISIDLMSLASVKSAADSVLATTARVDALICDAGLLHPIPVQVTGDGFESAVQIEYISHFYLVELLLPELRKTRGRVVHTSTVGIDSYQVRIRSGLPADSPLNMATLSKVAREPNQGMNAVRDGNIFMGLWMKSMHARILARKEASSGVTAYSFHPGLVASSGDMKAFYDAYGGKDALVQMCKPGAPIDAFSPSSKISEHCQQNPAWKAEADTCIGSPWYSCLCGDSCPLTSEQGAVTGAYLASAPKADLESINGAMTVACDYVPLVYGDPYLEMVGNIGLDATTDYLESFYALSLSWVPSVTQSDLVGIGSGSASPGVGIGLWTGLILLFASAAFVGVRFRRRIDNGESSYMPLA